jgi:hypothetical protein
MFAAAVGALGLALAASGSAAARASHAKARAAAIRFAQNSAPAQGKYRVGRHQLYTTNWSGWGVTNNATFTRAFSDVIGTWQQPAGTCAYKGKGQESNAAIFAGLDGINSGTVEQTGVDTICVGTQAEYIPWYEFYPARTVVLPGTVSPGDTMTAEVSVSGNTVTTTLKDNGTTLGTGTTSRSGLALNSAEWIVERNIQRMTNFGQVDWTSASARAGSTTAGIDNGPWDPVSIIAVNHNGPKYTECAYPGSPSSTISASAFTDYWNDCS